MRSGASTGAPHGSRASAFTDSTPSSALIEAGSSTATETASPAPQTENVIRLPPGSWTASRPGRSLPERTEIAARPSASVSAVGARIRSPARTSQRRAAA